MQPQEESTHPASPIGMKPSTKKYKIIITFLVLLFLGAGSAAGYFWWQTTVSNGKVTDLEARLSDSDQQVSALKKASEKSQSEPVMNSDTVDDSLTVTYENTEANRNILFWKTEGSSSDLVEISHKAYREFMAAQKSDVIGKICGTEQGLKAQQTDLTYGSLNIKTKQVMRPANPNCVDAFADPAMNKDGTMLDEAKKLKEQIKKDVEEFLKSATFSS